MGRRRLCAGLLVLTLGWSQLALAQDSKPTAPEAEGAKPGLLVGKYKMLDVVDGDTLRVEISGKSTSLRLLGIDTEEAFHDPRQAAAAAKGFAAYSKKRQGKATRPTKYGTPWGMAAKRYAAEFFKGVKDVEIERDDPGEGKGYYGRLLAYVFAFKEGKRVNYNVEVVRNGYSPYYVKYGRSRHYEKEFQAAEAEAKGKKLGIWGDWKAISCYPDYPARLSWWASRAKQFEAWRQAIIENDKLAPEKRKNLITLSSDGGYKRLLGLEGKVVELFGTIDRIRHPNGKPSKVVMSAPRERIDVHLTGRIKDAGKFRRELGHVRGKVVIVKKRVSLIEGELLVPVLELKEVPAATPGSGSRRHSRRSTRRFDLEAKDEPAYAVLDRLVKMQRAKLVIASGARPLLETKIRLVLKGVTLRTAVRAIAKVVGLPVSVSGQDTFSIRSLNDGQRKSLLEQREALSARRHEIALIELRRERERMLVEQELAFLRRLDSSDWDKHFAKELKLGLGKLDRMAVEIGALKARVSSLAASRGKAKGRSRKAH